MSDDGNHTFSTSADSDVRVAYLEHQLEAVDGSIRRELVLLRDILTERYETQTKAVDAAFQAQQTAMQTAFASTEKAVDKVADNLQREFHEHLVQYRHEVALAFESSDRAISKAEAATEKRFESVNEFRAQLNDQAQRFLARTEYDAAHNALVAKVEEQAKHQAERLTEVNRRLDLQQGKSAGIGSVWAIVLGVGGLLAAVVGIVAFFNSGA